MTQRKELGSLKRVWAVVASLAGCCAAIAAPTLGLVGCRSDGPAAPIGPDTVKPHGIVSYSFRGDSAITVTLHATDNVAVTRATWTELSSDTYEQRTGELALRPAPTVDTSFTAVCPYLQRCRFDIRIYDGAGNWNYADHSIEWQYPGPTTFTATVTGLPTNGVLDHVGMALVLHTGPMPAADVRAYIDSGTAQERDFATGATIYVDEALPNGPHKVTVWARNGAGATAPWTGSFTVAIASAAYHSTLLQAPGAVDARGVDMNNTGAIAGFATFADSSTQAMYWAGGARRMLPGPGSSRATALNDSGDVGGIVGTFRRDGIDFNVGGSIAGVVWNRDGTVRTLPDMWSVPIRIANNGNVLISNGTVATATGVLVLGFTPTDMNEAGVVVGEKLHNSIHVAELATFDRGVVNIDDLGGYEVIVWEPRINSAGEIAGTAFPYALPTAGFTKQNGRVAFTGIGFGPNPIVALNDSGTLLSYLPDGTGMLWKTGAAVARVMFDAPDWRVDEWRRINNRGQILTHAINRRTGEKAIMLLDPL